MATIPNPLRLQSRALNHPAVRQPARRAGAIRRTSSLQTLWTPGDETRFNIVGRARDLATRAARDPLILGEEAVAAELQLDGRLIGLSGSRYPERLERFAGLRV